MAFWDPDSTGDRYLCWVWYRTSEDAEYRNLNIEILQNGLAIALGTDSLSSNDDLDMVKEMNCLHSSFPYVPMQEILTWASLNGAKFLKKDDVLGTLTPGKKPGIVLVDNLDETGFVTEQSRSRRII